MRVAIIGGGPAGAQCARRLAEQGLSPTVFEPRTAFEKACGGGIPARGLERYRFLDDPRLPVRAVRTCLLAAPSGREEEFELRDPLYVFSRAHLHTFLLERAVAAGARILKERVSGFDRDDRGRWVLSAHPSGARATAEDARRTGTPARRGPFEFLVSADGAAGFCRRRLLGRASPSADLTQGIGYHLPGNPEDRVVLKFFDRLHGYLWVFPRLDHASAGICATLGARSAAGLRALMDDDLRARYGAGALDAAEPYAALIPGAPDAPGAPVQGEGWALAGDAGRFVDPLTREGIYYAMRSGDLLAGAIAAGDPRSYAAAWEREAGQELAWAATRGKAFFRTRFIERVVALCGASGAIARVISDLIAGRQPYRTLKTRLILNAPRVGWDLVKARAAWSGRPDPGAESRAGRSRPGRGLSRARDS